MTKEKSKVKKPYVYIGGSMRGRSKKEGDASSGHIEIIESVLRSEGYPYFADAQMKDTRINMDNPMVIVPKKYYENISESLVRSIFALRISGSEDDDENKRKEKLRYDIAMRRWTWDLIENSGACIFDMARSYTGIGAEIAYALELKRQTLILFSVQATTPGDYKPTLSALINGNTSRLLTAKQWNAETVEKDIKHFLVKVESKYDELLRFQISTQMKLRMEKAIQSLREQGRDTDGLPDFARDAIEKYLSEIGA